MTAPHGSSTQRSKRAVRTPSKAIAKATLPFAIMPQESALGPLIEAQLGLLDTAPRRQVNATDFTPEDGPEITFLVYQGAVDAIAIALSQGIPPQSALSRWHDQAKTHLTFLRAHRKIVFSTSLAQLSAAPEDLRLALGARYGCVFRNDAPGPGALQTEPSLLHRFVAASVLRASAQARRHEAELAALSWHSTPYTPSKIPSLDAVFDTLREADHSAAAAYEARKSLEAELAQMHVTLTARDDAARLIEAEASAKNTALSDALAQAEARAQKALHRADSTAQRLASLEDLLADAESAADKARASAGDLTLQKARLHRQVNQLEEALRTALLDTQKAQAEAQVQADDLRHMLAERDAHIGALYASRSWRLTAPLRRLRRMLRKG